MSSYMRWRIFSFFKTLDKFSAWHYINQPFGNINLLETIALQNVQTIYKEKKTFIDSQFEKFD